MDMQEAKIPVSDFPALWSTAENALLEISKTTSEEQETKQKLVDLQKRCLDEILLDQYRVKLLEQNNIHENIEEVKEKLENVEKKTEEIKESIEEIKIQQRMDRVPKKYTEEQEIKRRKIKEHTKARIKVHVDEKTFVSTNADKIAMESIQTTSMVVIVGPPGAGKSRMGLDLMRQYSELHKNYDCLQIDNITEWKGIVNFDDNCIILCDDIFGRTNCNYNENDHLRIIDSIHTCVKSGHVKLIVTMRDSITRDCDYLFTQHTIFNDTELINIGTEYKMTEMKNETV